MAQAAVRFAFDRKPAISADRIAFDYQSARRFDQDGVLHVAANKISKSNVCPYTGQEIMKGALNGDSLNLDPNGIYNLYRDPKELEKGAATFNGKPLLRRHVPHNVEQYDPKDVVGSIGSDAAFSAPYLTASLSVWNADAIAGIKQGAQRELSCSYRYNADMTPGTINGVAFMGVMRDIVANHVALVEAGRAGPDVMVHDQKLEIWTMAQPLNSRKALLLRGALTTLLIPRIANDAKIDLAPALESVNRANFKKSIPAIVAAVTKATEGKLAADENLDDLQTLLEKFQAINDGDLAADSLVKEAAQDEDMDEDVAEDEDMDDEGEPKKKMKKIDKKDDKADKKAMDAAIKVAVDGVEAKFLALDEAKDIVRPYVGAVSVKSAGEAYKFALDSMKVDYDKELPDNALKAILKAQPVPGSEKTVRTHVAMDEKLPTKMKTLFGVGA